MKIELSVQEENFVRQSPATQAILYPKLLIKEYKTINERGGFVTRLVVFATNFTATFFQDRIPRDQNNVVQRKSGLLMFFHRPGIITTVNTGRTENKAI